MLLLSYNGFSFLVILQQVEKQNFSFFVVGIFLIKAKGLSLSLLELIPDYFTFFSFYPFCFDFSLLNCLLSFQS